MRIGDVCISQDRIRDGCPSIDLVLLALIASVLLPADLVLMVFHSKDTWISAHVLV